MKWKLSVLLLMLLLLTACSSQDDLEAYRVQSPTEHYLYVPEEYAGDQTWNLLIAIHEGEGSARACFEDWLEVALEGRLILVCPSIPYSSGAVDVASAERTLADILGSLYAEYSLANSFFITGYNAGADFALSYSYRYPQAIKGVSGISASSYPFPYNQVRDLPVLVIIDGREDLETEAATSFVTTLEDNGFPVRLLDIRGIHTRLTFDALRVSMDFFTQVSR